MHNVYVKAIEEEKFQAEMILEYMDYFSYSNFSEDC